MTSRVLLVVCALGSGLAAALPRPALAGRTARGTPPALDERALGGGVVRLRSPASPMIFLPASSFLMGSSPTDVLDATADCAKQPLAHLCSESLFSNELAQHRVTLSAYWLDRHEVTVADYRRCVELRRCDAPPFSQGGRRFEDSRFPVSLVTFEDAERYCQFRGARLPTEAEYERAARGAEGRRYPWGNLFNAHVANHGRLGLDTTDDVDGYAELAPVGALPAGRTREGFLDLAGNVAEWTADRYAPGYPEGDAIDPRGPTSPTASGERVVRGGHYAQAAPWLRGAARSAADPGVRRPHIGFRCARSAVRREAKLGDE